MISGCTNSVPKEDVFPPLLYSDFRCSQACCRRSQVLPGLLLALPDLSSVLPDLSSALPDLSSALPGSPRLGISAPRLVVGTPRLVAGAPRCSQVKPKFPPAHRGVLKLIATTPMVLLYQSSEIPVTPKTGRSALLRSDTLLKLTHLSLNSTSSQTLLETSSD
jgi:hypothetical protein